MRTFLAGISIEFLRILSIAHRQLLRCVRAQIDCARKGPAALPRGEDSLLLLDWGGCPRYGQLPQPLITASRSSMSTMPLPPGGAMSAIPPAAPQLAITVSRSSMLTTRSLLLMSA